MPSCAPRHPSASRRLVLPALVLLALTVLQYWPAATFGFVWDDHAYLVHNYAIQNPVSPASLWWCLTRFAQANWHPLTWLTLHLEYQMFGLDPHGYHLVNIALHAANVLLLFAVLTRLTGALGKAFTVAALFAVHPLHVESVVWITELKDVLSTLFLLLVIAAHARYARRPTPWRLAVTTGLLALGLAAKSMLVSAPLLLLLLDWWPLGRFERGPGPARGDRVCPRFPAWRLSAEKIPLLLVAATAGVLTLLAQNRGGALADLARYPLPLRLGNAAVSGLGYLWRLAWPEPLSFYYPFTAVPVWKAAACALVLGLVTLAALALCRRQPAFVTGWLWYLISLSPVIGLIQVGSQAMADRYTYIPSLGVFWAALWLAEAGLRRLHCDPRLGAVLAGAAIILVMPPGLAYLGHWANEETLYTEALTVNQANAVAHNNLGNLRLAQGRFAKALSHYETSRRLVPASPIFTTNAGTAYLFLGFDRLAASRFEAVLAVDPTNERALTQLALARLAEGRPDSAEEALGACLQNHPLSDTACLLEAALLLARNAPGKALPLLDGLMARVEPRDPLRRPARMLLLACYAATAPVGDTAPSEPVAPRLLPRPRRVLASLDPPPGGCRPEPVATVLAALGYPGRRQARPSPRPF